LFIRQLFHIRQTGSVAEYVQCFAELVDQWSAYTSTTDPLYYTLRFIDGLRDDIKSVVLVQRPQDLDTACVLAALQEEVGDSTRRREFRRPDPPQPLKQAPRGPLPLPAPPRPAPPLPAQAADRRGVKASRAESSPEARAAALRTYRRAMGLCYKCGEKWSRDHSCAATVQLHVVQELWELFQLDDDLPELQSDMEAPSDHLFLAISKAAVNGISVVRTVRFSGSIQHIPVSILVDSGSSKPLLVVSWRLSFRVFRSYRPLYLYKLLVAVPSLAPLF